MARARKSTPKPASADERDVNVWLVGQEVSATQRRGRYVPESFVHPAKMLPELARKLILTYSQAGDLVVDLMSGIGTTGVEALRLGRRYIGVEIERRYAELQERNLAFAREQPEASPAAQIHCGDAREDRAFQGAALVAFSPPYQDAIHNQGDELGRIQRKIQSGQASPELRRRFGQWQHNREQAQAGTRPNGYSPDPGNLGHYKGDRYWDAMREVYRRAWEALKPGGYLAVVTKDQRDRKTGELTNLYGGTVAVCREVGFTLHQHIVAVLCRIDLETGVVTPRTSHWQRMAVRKAPEKGTLVLLGQFEDVAVFRKPR